MTYSFRKQFAFGKKHESRLDRLFADRFSIKPASRAQERSGIDRIFTEIDTGKTYTIQYKSDKTAARTGNAFVETVSVDVQGKPGWAVSCQADFIIYYVVDSGPAYILRPKDIRKRVSTWQRKYDQRKIPNRGYHTVGLLVPLREFEQLAVAIVAT
jgi:hypothetical protein